MSSTKIGVCNLCEAICGLRVEVEDDRVLSIRGNPADPLSRGHICPKGVALADITTDPDRLRAPVRRIGVGADARWEEIGWDEALDLAADGLARTIRAHGRDAVAVYLGNPTVHSLGAMTHGLTFVRALRSRNTYSATSVDQLPQQFAAHLMFGHQLLVPIPDLDRTDHFLVFGANPMASNGSLMTAPDFPGRLRALRERGGRMVVVDPRRTETARAATEHHFIRPGADAYVLLAMLHVLFSEELVEPPPYVRGIDRVRAAVADHTPARAEAVSGIPAAEIVRLARDFAAASHAVAYGRVGVSTQAHGTVCHWAINLLNLLTGNLDRPGGAMFTHPAVDVVGRGIVGRGHFARWRSRVRELPEFGGELPVAALREEIETPGEGQVRALVTLAGNPVLSTPDGARLERAVESLDFRVAVDIYLNETTRIADVVLPPTTGLERDHYDLIFHALAVRNTARFTPAVLPKPDGARHDWEIFRDLTLRLLGRIDDPTPRWARLLRRARLFLSPRVLLTGLLATGRQVSMRRLRRNPEGVDLGPLRPSLPGRLQTADRLVDAAPEVVLGQLPTDDPVPTPEEGTLLLIGRRHQRDCNSWMHNTTRLTKGRGRHQLLVHPADLAAHGIADGAEVRISSAVGSVITQAQASEDLMPGVVSLPHGYGHARPGVRLENARTMPGVSINDLTDPAVVDFSGNAVLSGVPVRIASAAPLDDAGAADDRDTAAEPPRNPSA